MTKNSSLRRELTPQETILALILAGITIYFLMRGADSPTGGEKHSGTFEESKHTGNPRGENDRPSFESYDSLSGAPAKENEQVLSDSQFRRRLHQLYKELEAFKRSKKFREFAFGSKGYKSWLEQVQELYGSPPKENHFKAGVAAGKLLQLGLEYKSMLTRPSEASREFLEDCEVQLLHYLADEN